MTPKQRAEACLSTEGLSGYDKDSMYLPCDLPKRIENHIQEAVDEANRETAMRFGIFPTETPAEWLQRMQDESNRLRREAVLAEREACAKIVEGQYNPCEVCGLGGHPHSEFVAIANEIRSRSKTDVPTSDLKPHLRG